MDALGRAEGLRGTAALGDATTHVIYLVAQTTRLRSSMAKTQNKARAFKTGKVGAAVEKPVPSGKTVTQEERDMRLEIATKLAIEFHREALKELERY